MIEPSIHSHLTDVLPDDHHLANKTVYCQDCHEMLHCENNECMQTWVEFPLRSDRGQVIGGNYCIKCFSKLKGIEIMILEWREE